MCAVERSPKESFFFAQKIIFLIFVKFLYFRISGILADSSAKETMRTYPIPNVPIRPNVFKIKTKVFVINQWQVQLRPAVKSPGPLF